MKIAVVGGGASGVATAYLLDGTHDVTLYEKEDVLGGHVRTLGRNVRPDRALRDGEVLDAGVIEFERLSFPTFFRLLEELDVEVAELTATTTLFLPDGRRLLSPTALRETPDGFAGRLTTLTHAPGLVLARKRFEVMSRHASAAELRERSLGDVLDDSEMSLWMRLLVMYAYSTPAAALDAVPAALAVPMLHDFLSSNDWHRLPGGAYSWFEAVLERFGGRVVTSARLTRVRRTEAEVVVEHASGETGRFDHIVFAATPDVPLRLLADPTEAERRRFGAWASQRVHVLVHHDAGPYERRGVRHRTEFDLFARPDGGAGYNAYLNRLCGITRDDRAYGLAFDLDDEIDPATVVHRQEHVTPCYTVHAYRWRDEVAEDNGSRRTWHAGAWLGDGLTEGAIRSAERVAVALGARSVGATA